MPVLIILLIAGCATTQSPTYNVGLDRVERPEDVQKRWGDYEVTEQDTTEGTKYIYEDSLVTAGILVSSRAFLANIENKSEHTIQVQLPDAVYVSPEGSTNRLVTGEMSYNERNDTPPPLRIPRNASGSTMLIPANRLEMGDYGLNVERLLPPNQVAEQEDVEAAKENVGKTFRLVLPIDVEGTMNEYTFHFEVLGARIPGSARTGEQTVGEVPESSE
jgi:hypothetical protein